MNKNTKRANATSRSDNRARGDSGRHLTRRGVLTIAGSGLAAATAAAVGSAAWLRWSKDETRRGMASGNTSLLADPPPLAMGSVAIGKPAPDFAFVTESGDTRRLSEFRGRPVMLWLFATWCGSCLVGIRAVAANFAALNAAGLRVVQLVLYDNLGYPGPSVAEVAQKYAPQWRASPDWVWGQAGKAASIAYDPRGIPDVYFLIDGQGILREVAQAPHVTLDKITEFLAAV